MYEIRGINTPHLPEAKGLGQMIFESFATRSSILCLFPITQAVKGTENVIKGSDYEHVAGKLTWDRLLAYKPYNLGQAAYSL